MLNINKKREAELLSPLSQEEREAVLKLVSDMEKHRQSIRKTPKITPNNKHKSYLRSKRKQQRKSRRINR